MGISRNLAINIEGNRSIMQVPLTIYYMDRGIDLLFEIKNMDYMFSGNMLENLDNAEVSIIIIKPNGRVFRTSKAQIENNLVKLTITQEFTDELDEIGTYKLQFQFYSNEGQDRVTIPPIDFNVVELIAPIDDSQEQGQVDYAFTDVAQVSTKKGGEITARWVSKEYITADKLNLMQENGEKGKAALEEIEEARGEEEDLNSRLTTIEGASKITNQTLGEVKKEVETARGEQSNLDNRFKENEKNIGTISTEIENARKGETNLNARLDKNDTKVTTLTEEIEEARGEEDSLVDRLNGGDKKVGDIEKELKIARGSYETLPNRLDTEEKHFYDSIAKINKEIGYRLEEGENITINHSHEGMMSNTEILGNTKYKREDNSLTDVWEEGVSLESTGEKEKNLIKVNSCGKNLFDKERFARELMEQFPSRVTRVEKDGRDCLKCLHLDRTKWKINIENNKQYTIKASIKWEGSKGGHFIFIDVDGSSVSTTEKGKTPDGYSIQETTTKKSVTQLEYTYGATSITYFDLDSIQLEESPTPTPYEPYQGDTKQIQLPHPLRKVGNVADRIYEKDGRVWLEQNINGYTLDGDEEFISEHKNFEEKISFRVGGTDCKIGHYRAISNNFKVVTFNEVFNGAVDEGIASLNSTSKGQIYILIQKNKLQTPNIEGFKRWLSENPTTVLYQLETPITTELDISNIDLKSYDNITHIMSDNNISPTIKTDVPYILKDTIEGLYTKEQANVEFDRVYEILNLNSYAPYKGENISIKHSKMGRTKDTEILGNTVKSKNLFDIVDFSNNKEEVTSPSIGTFVKRVYSVDKNKTYICSTNYDVEMVTDLFFTKDDEQPSSIANGVRKNKSVMVDSGEKGRVVFWVRKQSTLEGNKPWGELITKNIQIEEGKEATPYLPYGYLKSTSEEEENKIEILSCGKNLFDGSVTLGDISPETGITTTERETHCISEYFINVKENTNYCFSYTSIVQEKWFTLFYFDINKKYISYNDTRKNFCTPPDTHYIKFKIQNPENINIKDFQIEESLTPTGYEPYQGDTKQIQLPHPLRKVGDVADRIYEKDGRVWLEQNVGEVVLNGREDWQPEKYEDITYIGFVVRKEGIKGVAEDDNWKCDRFSTGYKKGEGIVVNGTSYYNIRVRIARTKLEPQDIQRFKKWLSENPTTVLYQLETPITTELDVSNIDLNTYNAMTHITSNNNIQPTINCQAPVDKDAINKELQETTLALEKENQKLLNAQNEQVAKDLDLDARMLTIEEAIKGEALTLDLGSVSKYSPYFMMKHCIEHDIYEEIDMRRKIVLYFRNKRITEKEREDLLQLLDKEIEKEIDEDMEVESE